MEADRLLQPQINSFLGCSHPVALVPAVWRAQIQASPNPLVQLLLHMQWLCSSSPACSWHIFSLPAKSLLDHFLLNAVLPVMSSARCNAFSVEQDTFRLKGSRHMMLQGSRRDFLGLSWGAGSAQACARCSAPEQDPERRGKHSGGEGGRVESGPI